MRKLWVSISGGRTSAYMAIKLQADYSDRYDLKFIYANTGQEHEETLAFLDRIDRGFSLGVVWVEAVVNHDERKGTGHKVVSFETAARKGEPFEEVIKKYGIPNQAYPHCTRELKISPMVSYINSIGWKSEFRAIGIRIDEVTRCRDDAAADRIIYPLIDFFPTEKEDVLEWFSGKDYDLKIPEHMGNCVTCWKKSDPKLFAIARDEPERFGFNIEMERKHGLAGHNIDGNKRVFFRGNRGAGDIIKMVEIMPELDFSRLDRCVTEECGMG